MTSIDEKGATPFGHKELAQCESTARNVRSSKPLSGQNRADISTGARVDIVLKKDQATGTLTTGHVKRILTKSAQHPHGIKVMLVEGNQVGRVKVIHEIYS